MIDEHDARAQRCRRLGHEVSFDYCRREAAGRLCSNILDCWWEFFDVRGFLEENAPEKLHELLSREKADKLTTLVDLIERAKRLPPDEGR